MADNSTRQLLEVALSRGRLHVGYTVAAVTVLVVVALAGILAGRVAPTSPSPTASVSASATATPG